MSQKFVVTEKVKRAMLETWPEDLGESPFENPGDGQLYLRFNQIRMENVNDAFGGICVALVWNGRDTCLFRAEGATLEGNKTITINGVEGRTKVELA